MKGPIRDLDWITWAGRHVVIAYDADVVTKDLVRIARAELAAHLRGRGALVGFLEWDGAKGKGIDDHLATVGPRWFSMPSRSLISPVPRGRKTCCAPNRL